MRPRTFIFLLLAVVGAISATVYYVAERGRENTLPEERLLYPDLKDRINEIAEVTVKDRDGEIVVKDKGDGWVIANRGDYPASFGGLKRLLLNLSEARILDFMTDNPDLYSKLGVQDVDQQGAASIQVTASDAAGVMLVDMVIGDRQRAGGTYSSPTYYVRASGEPRSMLVESDLEVSARPNQWLESLIFAVAPERIKEVSIKHPDNEYRYYRENEEEQDFALGNIPDGMRIKSKTLVNRIGTILDDFRVDDVSGKTDRAFGEEAVTTRIETFDGLLVNAKAEYVDGIGYAVFEIGNTEAATTEVEGEAIRLQETLGGWVYVVPFHKYDMLARKPGSQLEEISSDEPAPDPAEPPAQE